MALYERQYNSAHRKCVQQLTDNKENVKSPRHWPFVSEIHRWPQYPSRKELVMHYDDVIMGAIASKITSLTVVYSTVYSGADQSKHQSSASLAFVWGIHRGPGNSPHKWPVTRKMFPFNDVIMAIKFVYQDTIITQGVNFLYRLIPS